MPTCLDVYVSTSLRNRETVDRFLDMYVDRAACEDRGDEELQLLRAEREPDDVDAWEYEPAKTLTDVVERGLGSRSRAFAIYLRTNDSRCDGAVLAFTSDDHVVFGLSVPDLNDDASLETARKILHELASSFLADTGMVTAEEPPPLTPRDASSERRVLYRWSRVESAH